MSAGYHSCLHCMESDRYRALEIPIIKPFFVLVTPNTASNIRYSFVSCRLSIPMLRTKLDVLQNPPLKSRSYQ